MNIKIFLKREAYFGDPMIRCVIDETAPFFEGASQDVISAKIGLVPGYHELIITHYNKQDSDHLLDEQGNIVKDKYVEIVGIEIDDIAFSIDELREGHFYPVYNPYYYQECLDRGQKLPPSISPNLYLGHNGTWKLNFHTPFVEYIIAKRKKLNINLDNTIFQTDAETLKKIKTWFENIPDMTWKN
jgi:hypothetical protein